MPGSRHASDSGRLLRPLSGLPRAPSPRTIASPGKRREPGRPERLAVPPGSGSSRCRTPGSSRTSRPSRRWRAKIETSIRPIPTPESTASAMSSRPSSLCPRGGRGGGTPDAEFQSSHSCGCRTLTRRSSGAAAASPAAAAACAGLHIGASSCGKSRSAVRPGHSPGPQRMAQSTCSESKFTSRSEVRRRISYSGRSRLKAASRGRSHKAAKLGSMLTVTADFAGRP